MMLQIGNMSQLNQKSVKMGIIYAVKNKINGKYYIGQTFRTLEQRKREHLTEGQYHSVFHLAIDKYGPENFEWQIIDESDDQDTLNLLERLHIYRYESLVSHWGYNLKDGGSNGKYSTESKLKMSMAQTGKQHSKKTKEKMSKAHSGSKHHFYGKHLSEDHKQKISKAHQGKKLKKEHITKVSQKQWGKYPGASFNRTKNPEKKCWKSSIQFNKHYKQLGLFEDPISASLVYQLVWNEIYKT